MSDATGEKRHETSRQPIFILVHGIFNTGRLFRRLRAALEREGFPVFAPSLKPRDARTGIHCLGETLKRFMDEHLPGNRPVCITGFSMGGLVARYYVQKLKPDLRIPALITISTPHHGSRMSRLYPGIGTRQMRPGSPFLKDLNANPQIPP